MKNIIDVVNLIRILENENISNDIKIEAIKSSRDRKEITGDDAIELVIEYGITRSN